MTLPLPLSALVNNSLVSIPGSKSLSNRLLILGKLYGGFTVENLSDAEDTQLLSQALTTHSDFVDIHHAGTAMRFLTAYFAVQNGRQVILTGSDRMKQRPVKPLVNALQNLGAEISYLEQEGFPPLKIIGKKLEGGRVRIDAGISSQFVSALLLIAPALQDGLQIELNGEPTSRPYLEMTLSLLKQIGASVRFEGNKIEIENGIESKTDNFLVEGDWSSASYFYSLAAVGRGNLRLKNLKKNSLQGDSSLVDIYRQFFGVESNFIGEELQLTPMKDFTFPDGVQLDMNACPDIAQTVAVTAAALPLHFEITGLHTLKIKETDRLQALQSELEKFGCETEITENSIRSLSYGMPEENIEVATYNDHRMAMAFAPFALKHPFQIEDPNVVAKSYPLFWEHFFNCTKSIR
ncbi:MAG: 3-phosphoshikimate 1-carboxyvinyltransferase [Chryseobacterium sp.]|nr:MAG: 3-phosphoshikimate 1-carboxyvinyltransferase [Chryseobacterium sp.]